MELLYILIPLIAGIGLSTQSAINGTLGNKIGSLESAFLTFFTGAIILTLIVNFFGQGNILGIVDAPAVQLLAAIFGVIFLSIMPFVAPVIGVTNAMIMVIIGQLLASVAIDHFGLFSSEVIPLDIQKVIGILLLIGAVYFIFKKPGTKEVA
ncbi:DMT family transporter [Jeotgalibacillus terrae]|uniref:DMT family transporter n=1 Tax=Jeotgalibacillus terrae TaxID=587735 RepID=A0ABW5ZK34_9BACL|nr:DMT family transporter [Jeotgalibacillus terrae]MBM7578038.1 transporter family-2 protein [Jeotgalibacillus terrae]